MSADKLQAVHEALADVFKEPNRNAVGKETSHTTFDQEALSVAFGGSRLSTASPEHSFTRFDHAALTGIFNETLSTPSTERLSPNSFDQAFGETLNVRPPQSDNTQFPQQALSEMSDKPPPVSTNTRPAQPSFDHQALAEMLAESRADPIDLQLSRTGYDTGSPTAPFLGRNDHGEQQAPPSTDTSPTNTESERSPRGRSFLAKLHHIFTTKDEPQPAENEKKSLHPRLASQADPAAPIAIAISTPAAKSIPTNSPLVEPSSFGAEQELKSLHLSGHSGPGRPTAEDVVVTALTDTASAPPRQATSWPNERFSPVSTNTKAPLPTVESNSSTRTVAGPLNNVEQQATRLAAATSSEAKGKLPLQAKPLLVETVSSRQHNVEPPITTQGGQSAQVAADQPALENMEHAKKPDTEKVLSPLTGSPPPSNTAPHVMRAALSQPVLSGQKNDPAEETIPAAASDDSKRVQPQLPGSLFAERASLNLTQSESSRLKVLSTLLPPTFSDRVKNTASPASIVGPSTLTNAENTQPQPLQSLMAELTSIISADSRPLLASSEKEASPTQSGNPEPAARTTSVVPQNGPDREAQPSETERLLDEILSSAPSDTEPHLLGFENEISPPPHSGELNGAGPEIEPNAAASSVYTATQQTTSLPLADRPALLSIDPNHSWPVHDQNSSHSPSLGQFRSFEPSGQASDAATNEVEGGLPLHVSPLVAALRVLNARPSPPLLEEKPSRLAVASQQDNVGMAEETIARPSDVETMLEQPPRLLISDGPAMVSIGTRSAASIFEEARPISDREANEVPTLQLTPVVSSADTESAVIRARQAKSLLDQLDLNTAIHLRWTMRDIRSKRTKFSPVSANDLTALVNLGLVEMRDGLPRLTALGITVLG
jgi:hypothetical protein